MFLRNAKVWWRGATKRRDKIATYAAYALVFIVFWLRCVFVLDPDFGWHLNSGGYILGHGIPYHDIYTYTASAFPWIHHEWLSDVINVLIYNAGGFVLLGTFFAALWTAAVYLIAGKVKLREAVIVVLAAISFASFVSIRDVVWTTLLLSVIHRAYDKHYRILPFVFLLWANLHGGFVIGFVYLAWRITTERHWPRAWVLPAVATATLVNPYGIRIYHEILTTLFDTGLHHSIMEWQSWAFGWWAALWLCLWAVPVAVDIWKWKQRWPSLLGFDVFLLAATISSIRQFPLFVLFSLPRLLRFYGKWPKLSLLFQQPLNRKNIIKRFTIMILVYFALLTSAFLLIETVYEFGKDIAPLNRFGGSPKQAVDQLKQRPCKGNLFNMYDIGGYLIWQYPEQKVYIDGRMPSWTLDGKKYMTVYEHLLQDDMVRRTEFKTYNIQCAIVGRYSNMSKSLRAESWNGSVDEKTGWELLRNDQ